MSVPTADELHRWAQKITAEASIPNFRLVSAVYEVGAAIVAAIRDDAESHDNSEERLNMSTHLEGFTIKPIDGMISYSIEDLASMVKTGKRSVNAVVDILRQQGRVL